MSFSALRRPPFWGIRPLHNPAYVIYEPCEVVWCVRASSRLGQRSNQLQEGGCSPPLLENTGSSTSIRQCIKMYNDDRGVAELSAFRREEKRYQRHITQIVKYK